MVSVCWKCGALPDTRTPIERARESYAEIAKSLDYHQDIGCRGIEWQTPAESCPVCAIFGLYADAASIALDLAVAEACNERTLVMVP